MGKIITTATSYVYRSNNGNDIELLNAVNHKVNYSNIPLHYLDDDLSVRVNLAEILTPVLKKNDVYHNAILLRLVSKLLTNSIPTNVLYISDKGNTVISYMCAILELFNKESRLYWYTNGDNVHKDKRVVTIRADYEKVLLPENKFDFIVVDNLNSFSQWLDIINKSILSAKIDATMLSISIYNEQIEAFNSLFTSSKSIINDTITNVQEFVISQELIAEFKRDTKDYKISENIKIIYQSIEELSNLLEKDVDDNIDDVLDYVIQIENIIKITHPYLQDRELKFRFNLFKEVLIDYRLGMASIEEVKNNFYNINCFSNM